MENMSQPKTVLIQVRASEELAAKLVDAANTNRRTRSAEALVRLERSFMDGTATSLKDS